MADAPQSEFSMILTCTSCATRYFAQDDARQAALATQLIEESLTATDKGWVSLVALLETVWVMQSCYDADEATVVEGIGPVVDEPVRTLADVERLHIPDPEEAFAAIGYGKIQPKQVLVRLVPADSLREKPPDGAVTAAVKRAFGAGEEKITVRGAGDVLVFRASNIMKQRINEALSRRKAAE
mgnify:CR=1 FL=1